MYAMDHTTHFEHRIESRPARRFLRRGETSRSVSATDDPEREESDPTAWPLPEFAD